MAPRNSGTACNPGKHGLLLRASRELYGSFLVLQSRFGDKLLGIGVICPLKRTGVLTGLTDHADHTHHTQDHDEVGVIGIDDLEMMMK